MIKLNNKKTNTNGHGEYTPETTYIYLAADVFTKKDEITGKETVVYTDDVIADIFGKDKSEHSDQDNVN